MEQSLPRPAACRAPLRWPFWFGAAILLGLAVAAPDRPAVAAPATESAAAQRAVVLPGFWDPRRRPERPDLTRIQTIRFLTDVDYPPFDYAGTDGNPTGLNVDLARLICDEIKISCTIQARPFATLLDALNDNRGDAVIASIAPTAETRRRADFTDAYYRTPARFVARTDSPIGDVLPERLEGKKIAVIAGTAHEAYLKAMFTEAEVKPYPTAEATRDALRRVSAVGAIEAITASPRLSLSASSSVLNDRAWMVQLILISSQMSLARSILKPAGLPSGPT